MSRRLEAEQAEFAYGNTRLRARRSSLLGADALDGLLVLDLDGLLGALAETAYRADVEAALPRCHGVLRVHAAVRSHLGRTLEELRGFYDGAARTLVDLQLSRWDVRNLVALVRGAVRRAPPDDVLGLLVPVGGLDDASAREIARQAEPAAAVQLLHAWRLPTPADADALAAAWPAYERSEDLAALERALVGAHAARLRAALDPFGGEAGPLRVALDRERDDRDVVTVLRLRETGEAGGGPAAAGPGDLLGREEADADSLVAALLAPTREEAAAALARRADGRRREQALRRWAAGGSPAGLEDELERLRLVERMRLFVTGDPLSIAVPLAFEAAVEAEARNLRTIGEGAARGVDPGETRALLVVPGEVSA